jgi:predicted DNA-binding ribbon-helix-helix protein
MRMHNIAVSGRRTTIRLEEEMWESLKNIAQLEGCSINDLCERIDKQKQHRESLSSSIRVCVT